jgi:choline dehydrogenase-like flavoprotein
MQMAKDPQHIRHVRNILMDLPRTLATAANLVWQKFLIGRRKPFLFLASRSRAYPLHYHAEHIANEESRVQLGERRDRHGLLQLKIDQKFTQRDADGVVRAHQALDELLQISRLGRLVYQERTEDRSASVLSQASDGFHQMGLMRMGTHAQDGVVDRNCRVFGLDNMFVVGTGIFRTSGQANPTFFATALGLRLADHIASLVPARTAQ